MFRLTTEQYQQLVFSIHAHEPSQLGHAVLMSSPPAAAVNPRCLLLDPQPPQPDLW
jgi:hypothetical protein